MKCRGITFILSAIIFRIVPTALEISLVCGILVSQQESELGKLLTFQIRVFY